MKQILLVDDDAAVLSLLSAYLKTKPGVSVRTATNGAEALEDIKKSRPDLIVLDVMMPVMDGYGFLREVKKDERHRTIPIIVLTAREMTRDIFIQEGVRDFVVKPYDADELFGIISKYL